MHYDFPSSFTFSHSNILHNALDLDVVLTWKVFFTLLLGIPMPSICQRTMQCCTGPNNMACSQLQESFGRMKKALKWTNNSSCNSL